MSTEIPSSQPNLPHGEFGFVNPDEAVEMHRPTFDLERLSPDDVMKLHGSLDATFGPDDPLVQALEADVKYLVHFDHNRAFNVVTALSRSPQRNTRMLAVDRMPDLAAAEQQRTNNIQRVVDLWVRIMFDEDFEVAELSRTNLVNLAREQRLQPAHVAHLLGDMALAVFEAHQDLPRPGNTHP